MENQLICSEDDFYTAFSFLRTHPVFHNNFLDCLDVMVVKDPPAPGDAPRVHVWLECGPYDENGLTHDYDLDSDGDTFEEAIILLARRVRNKYGAPDEEALRKNKQFFDRRSEAMVLGSFLDETEEDS